MKVGDYILSPIFSISHKITPWMFEQVELFSITTINNKNYLRTKITQEDLEELGRVLSKFQFFCTGLSVVTIGHFWVDEILMNENLEVIWGEKQALSLLTGIEISDTGPESLRLEEFNWGKQMVGWIAFEYSSVFLYYDMGLFLLRVPRYGNVYPEALLNFFKIIELVTYKRTMKKAQLKVILSEAKRLGIRTLDEKEIKKYYRIRGRDVAHDWGKTEPVSREDVINCKHFAEEYIIIDMKNRRRKRKP
ncbi:hypothetical protein ACFLW8_04580 [Chloroflexota bacterium]